MPLFIVISRNENEVLDMSHTVLYKTYVDGKDLKKFHVYVNSLNFYGRISVNRQDPKCSSRASKYFGAAGLSVKKNVPKKVVNLLLQELENVHTSQI